MSRKCACSIEKQLAESKLMLTDGWSNLLFWFCQSFEMAFILLFCILYRVRVCIAVATQIIQSHIQCVTNFLQQATAATAVYVVIYLPAFLIVSTCKFRTF